MKRRPVVLDDPLGGAPAAPATSEAAAAVVRRDPLPPAPEPPVPAAQTAPAATDTSARWGGAAATAPYRIPGEMVDALTERVDQLGLPVGITVAAALDQLLSLPDEELGRVVRAAEAARRTARPDRRRRTS